ncbi:hypothetical protein [Cellulophaga fucicola]|uniref:hypothetical protein n=1 Tax=Cellulophaga fucicola TaxID=76595 RepID=UPI003EBFB0F4
MLKNKASLLLIFLFIAFSSCIELDKDVKIENIVKELKQGKSTLEQEKLDHTLMVIKTISTREKINKAALYDGTSINEIYLKTIEDKSFEDLEKIANDYVAEKKERIKYLEKEIKDRRAVLKNKSEKENVEMTSYIIYDYDSLQIKMDFVSSAEEGNETGYIYVIELYNLESGEVLQTLGSNSDNTSGLVFYKTTNFTIEKSLSKKMSDTIKEASDISYPITDLSTYNIGLNYYIVELKKDPNAAFKPREEDNYTSKKSLDELKKDIMTLRDLVIQLSFN